MPEAPARLHLRQVPFEALDGCVVDLLVDLKMMFQYLPKLRRQAVATRAGIAGMWRAPRPGDPQALSKQPDSLGHTFRDPDNVNLVQDANRFLSLGSALLGVAQVDPAGRKEESLHACAGNGDLLRDLYQRGQGVLVELLWSMVGRVGLYVEVPQDA